MKQSLVLILALGLIGSLAAQLEEFDEIYVADDAYLGDSSGDLTTVRGEMHLIRYQTINLAPVEFTVVPAIGDQYIDFSFSEGTGNIYLKYTGGFKDLVAIAPLDVRPGTVIHSISVEGQSEGGGDHGDVFAELMYTTSAEAAGLATSYRVSGRADASNSPRSTSEYATHTFTGGGHTVVDGRIYYVAVGANGDSGDATAVRLLGVIVETSREVF
jgi:hypothetical protein